jgi:hypothetical protein
LSCYVIAASEKLFELGRGTDHGNVREGGEEIRIGMGIYNVNVKLAPFSSEH